MLLSQEGLSSRIRADADAHLPALPPEINAYNMSSWNDLFIRQLRSTPAFALWDRTTDAAIFDLVEPRQACFLIVYARQSG